MQITSNYIPLDNNWAFLEFEYNSIRKSIYEYSFLRTKNNYNQTLSYFSYSPNDYQGVKREFGNVLDTTFQQSQRNKWVRFDLTKPIRLFEDLNPNIFFQSVYDDFKDRVPDFFVNYHTIKIHIARGYNFTNIDGFLCRVSYVDDELNQVYVANSSYLKSDDTLKFHTNDFRIGETFYDRYFEIRIPDIQSLHTIDNNLSDLIKIEDKAFYNPKSSHSRFPKKDQSRINIIFYEIEETETDNAGQLYVQNPTPLLSDNNGLIPIQLLTTDIFNGISATIRESRFGDYFEFFPSFEGEFIKDFIMSNSDLAINQFMVFHDLILIEQSINGGRYVEEVTQNLTMVQEDNFDLAYIYRPVILNPNTITFTIDYTVRIFDKVNNSNIVRRASLTYRDAQKYGSKLRSLDVDLIRPIKVVNKIVNTKNNLTNINNDFGGYPYMKTNLYESFNALKSNFLLPIDFKQINISNETVYLTKELNNDEEREVLSKIKKTNSSSVFGQKKHFLELKPFDTFIQFSVYQNFQKNNYQRYNFLRDEFTKYFLVFELEDENKIRIPEYDYTNIQNFKIGEGEILFKINENDYNRIKDAKKYFIVLENYVKKKLDINKTLSVTNFNSVIYEGRILKDEE